MAEALPSDTCDFPFLCQFAENSLHSTLGYLVFHGNFRHSDFGASTNFIDNRALQTDIQTDTLRSFVGLRLWSNVHHQKGQTLLYMFLLYMLRHAG